MLHVPGTKIYWKHDKKLGPLVSWEGCDGETWHYTYHGEDEFRRMHPEAIVVDGTDTLEEDDSAERELFGETLDEEIPDDFMELLRSF